MITLDIQLKLTYHAKVRMAELAISKDDTKRAIKIGSKVKQTDGFLLSYTYLKVAYKKIGENVYKIKTVHID